MNEGCEAMVEVNGVWTRCGRRPTESHHLLTRARGGRILDAVGETYHLINLCPRCHRAADGAEAYERGLLINGYVTWSPDKTHPIYVGTNEYLSAKYPRPSWYLPEEPE